MASITIRNLDEALKGKLRVRAARHGRSMEEEARDILRMALAGGARTPANLADALRQRFAPFGGIDLPELPDAPLRDPPDFSR